ncbi:hypothetical protein [Antribacter gilvus]|uniref:hypothetical protein n=1 Tax=Antribacter gilvus TaxID=2304675 RepID=UPI000F7BA8DD|nr:hypothetical protein [Antribacter gilvus]
MSTDEQFTARLRGLADGLEAPTPVDPDALASVAVRRTRTRRAVVRSGALTAVAALVVTAAFTLPNAGRPPLPGGDASPSAGTATSPSPEVSAESEAAPSPDASSLPQGTPVPTVWRDPFVYEAATVPDGWQSTGVTGLALALPDFWTDRPQDTWQNLDWYDKVASDTQMAAMAAAEQAGGDGDAVPLVLTPNVGVFVGTYGTTPPPSNAALRDTNLAVPGADKAHLLVHEPNTGLPGLELSLIVHQAGGLWYSFHGNLPTGDEGLAMADAMAASLAFMATGPEILAALPAVDHLPVLELARGIPEGWTQHDKHGLGYALPPGWAVDTRAFEAGEPAVAAWYLPDGVAPGLDSDLTIIWSHEDYIPQHEPTQGTKRLMIDAANLATTFWGETDWGVDPGGGESALPVGTIVLVGHAIVERADGGGHYTVSWSLPAGSGPLVEQFLGTLTIQD